MKKLLEVIKLMLLLFLIIYGINFIAIGWVQVEYVNAVPNFLFGFGICAISLYFIILEFKKA